MRADAGAAEIVLADVAPVDPIELAVGGIVPAGLRIISAKDLLLTQTALTGESDPVEKRRHPSTGLATAHLRNVRAGSTPTPRGPEIQPNFKMCGVYRSPLK